MLGAFKRCLVFVLLSFALVVCSLTGFYGLSFAKEFLDVQLDPLDSTYLVVRDVNVRAKPNTKSKRVSGLKQGDRVSVVGKYQGWLAIMKDGKPYGFAYFKYLVPLIEGALEKSLGGTVDIESDGRCIYKIIYTGKSMTDSAAYGMSDYDIQVDCIRHDKTFSFKMFMFITEGAYNILKPDLHQISIDLLEIDTIAKYDAIFSTNIFYNSKKDQVAFDEITIDDYKRLSEALEAEAKDVPAALSGAVSIALKSWSQKAWDDLIESTQNGGG